MAEPEPDKDPLVGQVVDGRYRIVARLSEGGMGVVYRAEHVFLKRDVALKRLHPELTGHGEAVARFEREAQAAARIDHPNVCSVLDCGVGEDGALYVAMELLEGASLEHRIVEAAPLPLPEIVDVAVQICDALGRAHDLGVVHRDLKPENVMLVPRREGGTTAKIMDFGIAKVAQEGSGRKLTQAGMVFGTPQYMAPEQAAGSPVDSRADIYALGVILYQMAAGRCPFESPTVAGLLTKHLTEPPPPLEAVAPHLAYPPPFPEIVAMCLAKEPDARFPSAAALAAALAPLRGMHAVVTGPPPPAGPEAALASLPTAFVEPPPSRTAFPVGAGTATPAAGPVTLAPGRGRVVALVAGGVAALFLIAIVAVSIGDSAPAADVAAPGASAGARPSVARPSRPAAGRDSAPEPPRADAGGIASIRDLLPFPEPSAPPVRREAELAAQRRAFEESDERIAAAMALARRGAVAEAISRLEWLSQTFDGNAHYEYGLAMLYGREGKLRQAMERGLRAAEIDGRYYSDMDLLSLAGRAIAAEGSHAAAGRFLERALDQPRAETLVRTALDANRSATVMRRIHATLARSGLVDPLPRHLRLPLLAVVYRTCPERKAVFEEIAAAPDARMAPYVQRFKGTSGCGLLNMQDCYACERPAIGAMLRAVGAAEPGGGGGG